MQHELTFDQERIVLEVDPARLAGAWSGPAALPADEVAARTRTALGAPLEYPPLRQAVVPDDSVAIACDRDAPASVVAAVVAELRAAAVGPITIVTEGAAPASLRSQIDADFVAHDRDDPGGLAYLAATRDGRRVYLARGLTDADVVLAIGRLGSDPRMGRRGPWSAIDPMLSDRAADADRDGEATKSRRLSESLEVGWLLGVGLEIGFLPGGSGVHEVVAGAPKALRAYANRVVPELAIYQAEGRADLVIAAVSRDDEPTTLADLAAALRGAAKLVEPGGKIALLSRAVGEVGPALRALMRVEAADPGARVKFRGLEDSPDYELAARLAELRGRATVYLLSGLDRVETEDLPVVPLDAPGQAGRLLAASKRCHLLNRANWTGVIVSEAE